MFSAKCWVLDVVVKQCKCAAPQKKPFANRYSPLGSRQKGSDKINVGGLSEMAVILLNDRRPQGATLQRVVPFTHKLATTNLLLAWSINDCSSCIRCAEAIPLNPLYMPISESDIGTT